MPSASVTGRPMRAAVLSAKLPHLKEWNEKCVPPWAEDQLRHKLAEAAKQPGPRGTLLAGASNGPSARSQRPGAGPPGILAGLSSSK